MTGIMAETVQPQRRRFARMPLAGIVKYVCAPNQGGVATWHDVGSGGACIRLYRYLRPGKYVLLSVKSGTNRRAYAELKGRVAWCRRAPDGGSLLAGVRVYDDTADAEYVFSELIERARGQARDGERSGARPATTASRGSNNKDGRTGVSPVNSRALHGECLTRCPCHAESTSLCKTL